MKNKNLNKIAKIEQAIAKKFGKETIVNPKSFWDDNKEKEYLEQLQEFYSKESKRSDSKEKTDEEGFLLSKNLISRESKRKCPVCNVYSFNSKDDLYMNKFECCFKCYVQWVEDREERWATGWRPAQKQKEQI